MFSGFGMLACNGTGKATMVFGFETNSSAGIIDFHTTKTCATEEGKPRPPPCHPALPTKADVQEVDESDSNPAAEELPMPVQHHPVRQL